FQSKIVVAASRIVNAKIAWSHFRWVGRVSRDSIGILPGRLTAAPGTIPDRSKHCDCEHYRGLGPDREPECAGGHHCSTARHVLEYDAQQARLCIRSRTSRAADQLKRGGWLAFSGT